MIRANCTHLSSPPRRLLTTCCCWLAVDQSKGFQKVGHVVTGDRRYGIWPSHQRLACVQSFKPSGMVVRWTTIVLLLCGIFFLQRCDGNFQRYWGGGGDCVRLKNFTRSQRHSSVRNGLRILSTSVFAFRTFNRVCAERRRLCRRFGDWLLTYQFCCFRYNWQIRRAENLG